MRTYKSNEGLREGVYPFKEGDDYYTIDGKTIVWSCWDEVSEDMYDESPDKMYFETKEGAMEFLESIGYEPPFKVFDY